MVRRSVSPQAYTHICRVAFGLLCTIVVTGAAVRLTGSGLGCTDWPRCNSEKFIDVSSTHGAIEQINRLFTGLVAAGVVVAVLAAKIRQPLRRDLVLLAWGLVVGVLAQIILGGIVVLTGLHPLANQGHFILSMVLIANAVILVRRSQQPEGPQRSVVSPVHERLVWALMMMGTAAIVTGTVVTATGPHAGDENAPRFGFDISHVARIHGATVIATLILCLILAIQFRRVSNETRSVQSALETVLVVGILQATVGYVQYFNNVPAFLVGVHIAGATAFFASLVSLVLTVRVPQPQSVEPSLVTADR
jgi:cytochrome c oxidase assembly protein subunit 15